MPAAIRPAAPADWLWLVAAVVAGLFLGLHSVPLFDLDEGAFSEATREMFARGDYLSTYLNGQPRHDKPILIYWLQAASVWLLGLNELAVRLPSALAATAWVALVYGFARKVCNRDTAWYAAIFTATAIQVSLIGRAAIADAVLNLWLAATMFAVYLYYQEPRKRYLYLAYAAMGLGFLTKGPIAVLVPGAVSLLFFVHQGAWRAWLKAITFLPGIALAVLIAAPWYILQYLRDGQAFIDGFFVTHNLGRFGGPMQGHGGSLLYYLPVLVVGLMPYSGLLVSLARDLRAAWRDPFGAYALMWFGFVFVFFSLSGTKLPHYLVYGYTGLLVLMAAQATQARSRWLLAPSGIFFLVLLVLPESLGALRGQLGDGHARAVLEDAGTNFSPLYRVYMAAGLALCAWLALETRLPVARKLALAGLACAIAFGGFLVPVAGEIMQRPIKEAAAIARASGQPLVMWRINTPSFLFYSEQLAARHPPRPGEVALTRVAELARLGKHVVLYRRGGIALVRMDAP